MKCPYCGDEESKVIDSRPTEDGERIRRRRECLRCRMRFTRHRQASSWSSAEKAAVQKDLLLSRR